MIKQVVNKQVVLLDYLKKKKKPYLDLTTASLFLAQKN